QGDRGKAVTFRQRVRRRQRRGGLRGPRQYVFPRRRPRGGRHRETDDPGPGARSVSEGGFGTPRSQRPNARSTGGIGRRCPLAASPAGTRRGGPQNLVRTYRGRLRGLPWTAI